jgi:hypothetical protein
MNDRIGRVAIPLEAAAEGGTAIETAAQLAARANAPLHGIFVEDEDLLSLANLPFARQVTLGAGTEPLPVERVELQLRVASVTRPALIPDGYHSEQFSAAAGCDSGKCRRAAEHTARRD